MNNENDFTGKCVLFADILGFSTLILEQKEKAKVTLNKFGEIFEKYISEYEPSNISSHQFSDSVVVGFKEIKDALSFSKTLFNEAFYQGIPLRGTIGIGDFTHIPNSHNKFSFTIGSGLVLANFADKYHVKGHTLILVCKVYENNYYYDAIIFKKIHRLPKEFKVYIVPWWKNSESKRLKGEIDERTHGLTIERLEYLEKTKENMNYFKERDSTSEPKPMVNTTPL